MKRSEAYAWAAGFLDGEGHFYAPTAKYVILRVTQVNPEPLRRLQKLMGGTVYGPRQPKGNQRQPYFVYNLGAKLLRVEIENLRPFLCREKRMQYDSAIDKALSRMQ